MKKLLYTFLAVSIIFAACKKEEGCTDPIAINYNADAEKDDGSCTYTTGCTDATACNYDPNAVVDDGSCIFPDGCTDPTAFNFDSFATCDDGSCLYKCNDIQATNYNDTTTSPAVCEYESGVVIWLDETAAQYFDSLNIPVLTVYAGNEVAGSMDATVGFNSIILCTDTNQGPVHYIYQWEDEQTTTLTLTVYDGNLVIMYQSTENALANGCLKLQLTRVIIEEYQASN
jgi:hypothetical protein